MYAGQEGSREGQTGGVRRKGMQARERERVKGLVTCSSTAGLLPQQPIWRESERVWCVGGSEGESG